MQLVERHIIKRGHKCFQEIDSLCLASKNLYNRANYNIRQGFILARVYSNYNLLDKVLKDLPEYKALPAKVSQQVLRGLERNWSSFLGAIQAWKEEPDKFTGRPRLPKYKDKDGRNLVVYTIQAISKPWLRKGIIKLSKTSIQFPTQVRAEAICEVRIVPSVDCYVIEVVYVRAPERGHKVRQSLARRAAGAGTESRLERQSLARRSLQESTQIGTQPVSVASVDLGLNNLMALTSNQKGFQPILVNGRPLKSINQFYNKRKASLSSKLKANRFSSKRLQHLTRKRNQKVNNYLHASSKFVVDSLVKQGIETLVIGKNDSWKQEINLGRQNNQNFVNIPHSKLIAQLTYKCQLVGIKVVIQEESYTSVASFLDLDPIPTYGEEGARDIKFSGRRIKRGLYRCRAGSLINADVNGSYNILRKAFPNAFGYGIESCVVQPRLVTPTKVSRKGKAEMLFTAA